MQLFIIKIKKTCNFLQVACLILTIFLFSGLFKTHVALKVIRPTP